MLHTAGVNIEFDLVSGIYADSYRNSQWFYLGGATSTETLDIDITESHASSSSSIFEATPDPAEVNPMTLRSLSVDPSMLSPSGKDDVNVSVDSGLGQRDTSPRLYKQSKSLIVLKVQTDVKVLLEWVKIDPSHVLPARW